MNHLDQPEPRKSPPIPRPLKAYTTPTLAVFGAVARLTKGSGGPVHDIDGKAGPLPH